MKLLAPDTIRRCFVANPGMSIFTADYDQIELRVMGALSGEKTLIDAAKAGQSLHIATAVRIFGPDYTPPQYKKTKNVNFTFGYGGTANTMFERYGIPLDEGRALIADYRKSMPSLTAYMKQRQDWVLRNALSAGEYRQYRALLNLMFEFSNTTSEGRAQRAQVQNRMRILCEGKYARVVTDFGRSLIVDAVKPYTILNYEAQSTAADIMKHGFLRVRRHPELRSTILLPVHDELIGQGPKDKAEYLAELYGKVMTTEFRGVPITASGKVYGDSWGDGYKKED